MRDTIQELARERNSLRLKLWSDPTFAHRWLCHPSGEECPDGCTAKAKPSREHLYSSEIEQVL